MNDGIWVWCEVDEGRFAPSTIELLGEARRLAQGPSQAVTALVLGHDSTALVADGATLAGQGADRIALIDDERLAHFDVRATATALVELAATQAPAVALFPATPNGSALAARFAAHLRAGFVAEAIAVTRETDGLRTTRTVALGKAQAVALYPALAPLVLTFRPGVIGAGAPDPKRRAEVTVTELAPEIVPGTRYVETIPADPKTVPLDEAELVVAGGLGFTSAEDTAVLWDFADGLKAAVGGSKPTVDRGWLPTRRLVGQSSGRRLAPKLFVAAGVSGASHFVEGMKDSELIVAINTDAGAPLMGIADLAVKADIHELLPVLADRLAHREKARQP